ncbi:SDR family NAD(P)-dependent oxidoreductase [Methyloversatilis discipulorum]|uniref:SDR family NAD(P)-dependent oxidoreductase n=1 Tax=Methyloversatilis discipulorum TaxID=1119528 RepID=UPI001A473209|nr:SDR family NAD(P)-dependent oxidoreductase [Methyloversatilis discipulorum]MBL8467259.1 SDR family NAD(P)-dependent oxidoreductase [Methyloversatilis discipulorum]
MKQSDKRVALVTGASSGIDEAAAKRLVAAGYSVYGTSRRGDTISTAPIDLEEADLMPRDVTVAADRSTVYYKDAMANAVRAAVSPCPRHESQVRCRSSGRAFCMARSAWE